MRAGGKTLEAELASIRRHLRSDMAAQIMAEAGIMAANHLKSDMAKMKRGIAQPLLDRLGPDWMLEEDAIDGLSWPSMRIFYAEDLGLIEHRHRFWKFGPLRIRLTRKGWLSE